MRVEKPAQEQTQRSSSEEKLSQEKLEQIYQEAVDIVKEFAREIDPNLEVFHRSGDNILSFRIPNADGRGPGLQFGVTLPLGASEAYLRNHIHGERFREDVRKSVEQSKKNSEEA